MYLKGEDIDFILDLFISATLFLVILLNAKCYWFSYAKATQNWI